MRLNIELTDRQARRMVNAIRQRFFVGGIGNFALPDEEIVELLKIAFNDNRIALVQAFYQECHAKFVKGYYEPK